MNLIDFDYPEIDPQIRVNIIERARRHAAVDAQIDTEMTTLLAEPTMLSCAWTVALWRHAAQKDKNNFPYWTHLETVRAGVVALGGGETEQIAAVLHDIVEDTPETIQTLATYGFPFEVLLTVQAVTKKNGEDNRLYIGRVIEAGESAMLVKLADLYTNTDPERLATLPDYTQERLKYKYYHAIRRIEDKLGFTRTISDEDYDKSQTYKKTTTSYTGAYTSSRDADGYLSMTMIGTIVGDMLPDLRTISKKSYASDRKVTLLMSDGNILEAHEEHRISILDDAQKKYAKKYGKLGTEAEIIADAKKNKPALPISTTYNKSPYTPPAPKKQIPLPPLPDETLMPEIPSLWTRKVDLVKPKKFNIGTIGLSPDDNDYATYEDAYNMLFSDVHDYADEEIAAGIAYIEDRIENYMGWDHLTPDEQSQLVDDFWGEFSGDKSMPEGAAWLD